MAVDLEAKNAKTQVSGTLGFEVPELSPAAIEAAADAVLADYERKLGMPMAAPIEVEDIATVLLELDVDFADLYSRFGDRTHGALWMCKRMILIEREINPIECEFMRPRFHFTLAHEIGHWILHRRLFIDDDGNRLVFCDEDRPDVICRSFGRRPRIERQADAFAGFLLMPRRLLLPAWREHAGTDGPIDDTAVISRCPNIDPDRVSFIDGDGDQPAAPRRLHRESFCEPLAQTFWTAPKRSNLPINTYHQRRRSLAGRLRRDHIVGTSRSGRPLKNTLIRAMVR